MVYIEKYYLSIKNEWRNNACYNMNELKNIILREKSQIQKAT